ncbi:MAG TPA: hypothetical protein VGH83_00190 [Candidatus Acidoferrum sp.]|jgi:hypothetical protein
MYFVILVLSILLSIFVGFLAGYMKKKGEDLATHENLGKLVEQMSAVTKATKDIEAKISSDVWDRQKRWELKREVLFDATKRLADVEDGLLSLDSILQVELAKQNKVEEEGAKLAWAETKHERTMKWSQASAAFDEARLMVNMACQKDTIAAFEAFGTLVNLTAAKITPGKDWEVYDKSRPEREKKRVAVRTAVRKELGIDEHSGPQPVEDRQAS